MPPKFSTPPRPSNRELIEASPPPKKRARRCCSVEGCAKWALKGGRCKKHGGGKLCQFEGCKTGAKGATDFCRKHGGGKRCQFEGCKTSAIGGTDFCVKHGGGQRCEAPCCAFKDVADFAPFKHNDIYICWQNACALIEAARIEGRVKDFEHLRKAFGMKKDLAMRGEQCVLFQVFKAFGGFAQATARFIDEPCAEKKDPGALKPDALFVFEGNFAIHLEHDEHPTHERSEQRLAQIHSDAGTIGKTAVIRWCEHRDTANAMCKRKTRKVEGSDYAAAYFEMTDRGWSVLEDICHAIECALRRIEERTQELSIEYINF